MAPAAERIPQGSAKKGVTEQTTPTSRQLIHREIENQETLRFLLEQKFGQDLGALSLSELQILGKNIGNVA